MRALALFALVVSSCGSGADAPSPTDIVVIGPDIEFEKERHDFGTIDDLGPATCTFVFVNDGDGDLVIRDVKPNCSCVSAEVEGAAKSYPPGAGSAIQVAWEPSGQGSQAKWVDVTTNAGPPLRLKLAADVRPFLRILPERPDFGLVDHLGRHTLTVGLECDDPDVEVTNVRCGHEHLDGRITSATSSGGSFRGELELVLSPDAEQGTFRSGLFFDVRGTAPSGEPVEQERTSSVRAEVYGPVRAEPGDFLVGRIEPGGEIRYRIRLVHRSGESFQVVRTELEDLPMPDLRLESGSVAGEEGAVDLFLLGSVGDYSGRISDSVRVWTDAGGEPLSLRVMGVVRD